MSWIVLTYFSYFIYSNIYLFIYKSHTIYQFELYVDLYQFIKINMKVSCFGIRSQPLIQIDSNEEFIDTYIYISIYIYLNIFTTISILYKFHNILHFTITFW